jgi:hypothetical protein
MQNAIIVTDHIDKRAKYSASRRHKPVLAYRVHTVPTLDTVFSSSGLILTISETRHGLKERKRLQRDKGRCASDVSSATG